MNFWGEKNLKIVYSRNQGFQKPENTPKADERWLQVLPLRGYLILSASYKILLMVNNS